MPADEFRLLFQILQSEQAILSRTDQKAYTLLSILGVFMVFFIVYFRLLIAEDHIVIINIFILTILPLYFGAAFLAIWSLVRTIMPRFHRPPPSAQAESTEAGPDPTFFGGIREFDSGEEYYDYIKDLQQDEDRVLRLLSGQVHALAMINWTKNSQLRRGIAFFIAAIGIEFLMILSMFIEAGVERLSG